MQPSDLTALDAYYARFPAAAPIGYTAPSDEVTRKLHAMASAFPEGIEIADRDFREAFFQPERRESESENEKEMEALKCTKAQGYSFKDENLTHTLGVKM